MRFRSLRHSIQGRLLLLAVTVEIIMLSLLVANSMRLLHDAMTTQARRQAEQYHPVLSAALTAPLAQRDYATVQAIINESRTVGGIEYVVVVDRTGNWVARSGWPEDLPLPSPSKDISVFSRNSTSRYDVAVPILRSKQPLGTLHFGLDLTQIISARKRLVSQGVSIAVAEVLLSSLIILLIGFWITRNLAAVTRASQQVAGGDLSPPPLMEGPDDVGQLGAAFNTMSRAISERITELTDAKARADSARRSAIHSEERLKLALTGADLGMWDWDIRTGRVNFSYEWAGMLGYTVDELEPDVKSWESLVHPEDMPHVMETLQRHLDGKTPMYETVHRCRTKSGGWRWILDRGRVVDRAGDGTPLRAAGTHLDITERKQAQDKLKQLNMELEERVQEEVRKNRDKDAILLHQDKMASIGQLAAGVAHEINNPMAFITSNLVTLKGYVGNLERFCRTCLEMSESRFTAEERGRLEAMVGNLDIRYLLDDIIPLIEESAEGADRVKRIVLDLKDFARIDENMYKPVDLNYCVTSTLNMVRNEIRYIADVDLCLGELEPVICSAGQINQVIANLLMNAAHAMEQHGTITITTLQTEQRSVVLKVSDTGRGMTDDVCRRIFEPFYTTKDVGKGTGLGLTISYDIIKKHGGSIDVDSRPGAGTTFTVTLPLTPGTEP